MDIKQHKEFLLSEIKVNNPTINPIINKYKNIIDGAIREYKNLGHNNAGGSLYDYICNTLDNDIDDEWDNYLSFEEQEQLEKDINYYAKNLHEGVDDFHIGQTSNNNGIKTTVKDIDTTTQSVTWDVKKEVTDEDIHKKLTQLISDFEKVKLKDFHSRPKLIQLVKDLKTIRNKFSRTIPK